LATVKVTPEILKWSIDRVGGLEMLQKKFPKLPEWLRMESEPTLKQLEKLANATGTPLGYFFLSEPPHEELTVPHYRTINNQKTSQPSVNLIDTIHTMERRQDWMRDYLIQLGNDPLPYVGSAKITDDPKRIAKDMREKLGLKNGWADEYRTWEDALRNLMIEFENIGILVMANGIVGNNTHRKLDVNEFRGFVLVDDYAPLIFINNSDGKAAQMFTLAHELAHIWYGASAIFDLKQLQPSDEKIEKACNETAAEFLVPEEELRFFWPTVRKDEDRYQQIAKKFKVSELVVVRRASDLELISKDEYFDFYKARQQQEKKKSSGGGDFYNTQSLRVGRRFANAVVNYTKAGKLLYNEAYRLTGLTGKTFEKFADIQERGRLQ
jgi:Zn-dependent peptidase ImmA (M78 family)/transcriptional regulator with XRE-family HTH domain